MTSSKKTWLVGVLLGLCLTTPAFAKVKPWVLDKDHSSMRFTTKHLILDKVDGFFKLFSAKMKVDAKGRLWGGIGVVDTNSVSTGNDERNEILRGKNLFDVTHHPKMTYRVTKVTYNGEKMTVVGKLTIKGITKPLTLAGKFLGVKREDLGKGPMDHAGYLLNGSVKRKDFGLDFEGTMNSPNVVAARVDLLLELDFVRAL